MTNRPDGADADAALGPYLRAIKARKAVVAAVTLVVLLAAGWMLSHRSPTYQTTAELLVTPLPQDDRTFLGLTLLRDSGDPTRTVQTASALITSPVAASLTARQLGGGLTRQNVEGSIKVEPIGESNIIGVTATASSARLAADLANRYAANSVEVRVQALRGQIGRAIATLDQRGNLSQEDQVRLGELRAVRDGGDPTLTLAQTAEAPASAANTPARLILVLGLVAGFILGTVVAVLAERFDRRIRDVDELVSLVPVPVLASIPTMRRIGPGLQMPATVREAFRTLQLQLEQRSNDTGRSTSTIVVTSASTQDGKTTTAICLALALASAGHEVILIDWDLRRPDIGRRLGLDTSRGVGMLATGMASFDDALQPIPAMPSLRVVTGDDEHRGWVPVPAVSHGLHELLSSAQALADYVVVDTAPLGVVGDALAVAPNADELLLVGRAHNSDRRAVKEAVGLLARAGTAPTGWVVVGEDRGRRLDARYHGRSEPGLRRFLRRPGSLAR